MKWPYLLLPLLAGCAATSHVYQLEDARAVQKPAPRDAQAPVLRMLATRSDSYDDRQDLTFGTPAGERGHYRYARWSTLPSQRLHELLFRRLDASSAFSVVLDSYAPGNEQCDLETVLLDWYHDTTMQPGQAVVSVRASLYGFPDQRLVSRQTFRATAPLQHYDGASAAHALDAAGNRLLNMMTDWAVSQAGRCRVATPAESRQPVHARSETAPQ